MNSDTSLWGAIGVTLPVLVYMTTHALKWTGFLKNGNQTRVAVLALSAVYSVSATIYTVFPDARFAIAAIFLTVYSIFASTAAWEKIVDKAAKDEDTRVASPEKYP